MKRLQAYRRKRDFERTPEPAGGEATGGDRQRFVIQKHQATRLHNDLRLERGGVLRSWALPTTWGYPNSAMPTPVCARRPNAP